MRITPNHIAIGRIFEQNFLFEVPKYQRYFAWDEEQVSDFIKDIDKLNIKNGEVFLKNTYIKPFEKATAFAPNTRRDRKLLLNKREIQKLIRGTKEKGYTIVATKIYLKKNLVKVEIALAKGKKLYDKKETLRQKAIEKEIKQATKNIKIY